ncbi:MAG: NADH-quinone oxidoreductase subunit J [Anaerolineae bacterium]|jgi:NADH-quinone oxidoreductase subunit J|nr:NADH-quinone oxidoreductase subunit J [Anaerolineae bacterium]
MTLEILLFMAVGAVTIATAAMMLLSNNAVHSALFLIVNFIGVAFLYLMLEAPFLALVQIAVYAGAIMVLFLFVIMLLGAEKTGAGAHLRRFRWMAPVAMVLALTFIITVGWALTQGDIDSVEPPAGAAQVRFVHAAPLPAQVAAPSDMMTPATEADTAAEGEEAATDEVATDEAATDEVVEEAPAEEVVEEVVPVIPAQNLPADRVFVLLVNGEVVDDSFVYGEETDFLPVEPGLAVISLRGTADGEDVVTTTLELTADTVQTAILAGDEAVSFYAVPQGETPGLTVFNAYAPLPALALGDLKGELFNDVRRILTVGADEVPFGTYTAPLSYPADFPNWVAYEPGRIDNLELIPDEASLRAVVLRVSEFLPEMRFGEDALIVLGAERRPDNELRPLAVRLDPRPVDQFGTAEAVGERLFTDYLLPFQLVAMLLLASMVGVIVITYRGDHTPKPSRSTRRKVARPLTSVITSQTGADLADHDAPQLPERAEQPSGD